MLEIGGIPVGSIGDARLPIVEALKDIGVNVSGLSIPDLRAGRMSGVMLKERFDCVQMLNTGLPLAKDKLYKDIAETALGIRLPQTRYPKRYTSTRFMERVAKELDKPVFVIDKTFRAMRVEAVMSVQTDIPEELLQSFNTTVNKFLDINDTPNTVSNSPHLKNLMQKRDAGVVFAPDNFYRFIYQNPGTRFIGSWVTQEVEWLSEFYGLRVKTNAGFSPLDRAVLCAASQGEQGFVSVQILSRTGIGINSWVIATHRNALLGRLQTTERVRV